MQPTTDRWTPKIGEWVQVHRPSDAGPEGTRTQFNAVITAVDYREQTIEVVTNGDIERCKRTRLEPPRHRVLWSDAAPRFPEEIAGLQTRLISPYSRGVDGWLGMAQARPGARTMSIPDQEPDPNRAPHEPPTPMDWLILAAIAILIASFLVFGFAYGPQIVSEIGRMIQRAVIRI